MIFNSFGNLKWMLSKIILLNGRNSKSLESTPVVGMFLNVCGFFFVIRNPRLKFNIGPYMKNLNYFSLKPLSHLKANLDRLFLGLCSEKYFFVWFKNPRCPPAQDKFNPYHVELYTQDITCMLNCFEEISQNLAFFFVFALQLKSLQILFQYLQEMMLVEYTLNFKTLETHLFVVAMATYFSLFFFLNYF